MLELYNSLMYGDPKTPRTIPFDLAHTAGLFQQAVSAIRQKVEEKNQYRAKLALEELSKRKLEIGSGFRPHYVDGLTDVEKLVRMYIPLHKHQSVFDVLCPYFNARFAPPWRDRFPKTIDSMTRVLSQLQVIRKMNCEARKFIRKQKWAWSKKEPPYGGFYAKVHFEESLLDAFQKFLEHYGQGALVVLVLLEIVNVPRGVDFNWPQKYYWYPHYDMGYLPTLANREPLEILLSLEKLADILSRLNFASDFAGYYWRADGENPYCEDEIKKTDSLKYGVRYRTDTILVEPWHTLYTILALPFAAAGQFDRELEYERDDLHIFYIEANRKRDWYWQKIKEGKHWWWVDSEKLVRTYLQCRACDIARYGERVADRTFPQPTIKDATPKQVADLVASLVTLLQKFARQKEKQIEEELYAKYERGIQQKIDREFSNNIIPMPDVHLRDLTYNEIEALKATCLKELRQSEK